MVTYLPRSAWKARTARGSTALVPSEVLNTAFHWPGMSKAISAVGAAGQARVASALRGWQNYHMDGRGWSDIAYQVAIDQEGRAWTLRGINIRSGANGDATVNRKYGAILLVLGPGEKPSAKMTATAKAVVADYRKRFTKMPVKPTTHSAVRPAGTDCPGDQAREMINAGQFNAAPPKPSTPTTPPTPSGGLTMADAASIERLLKDLDSKLLGRYRRFEQVTTATLGGLKAANTALAALAAQIKAEDVADDAALTAAMAAVNANIDELEAALAEPAVEAPKV